MGLSRRQWFRNTDRDRRIRKNLLLDVVSGVRMSVSEDDGADDAADVLVGPHAQQDTLRSAAPFGPQICKSAE